MEARYDSHPLVAERLARLQAYRNRESRCWNEFKYAIALAEECNKRWSESCTLINDTLSASGITQEQFAEMIEKGEL